MITAHLKGGLGNQMFQIAATYSLALDNGDECAFYLDNPNINQGHGSRHYAGNVFRNLKELPENMVSRPDYEQIRYMEPRFNFDPLPYRNGMVLQGFFQSEKYFIHHRKEIIELFQFTEDKSNFRNSVSIHVRRGDYLNPFMCQFMRAQPLEYYLKALEYIESKTKIENILVFSDDMNWCRGNFHDPRISFIKGLEDYVEMQVMSECNHNIISASSFSWWAAWLNNNNIVCAPAIWFGPSVTEDWQDIYCKNWVKI